MNDINITNKNNHSYLQPIPLGFKATYKTIITVLKTKQYLSVSFVTRGSELIKAIGRLHEKSLTQMAEETKMLGERFYKEIKKNASTTLH